MSVGSLLLVLLVAIAFLIATESGTRLLVTRLLPESVKVQSIDGPLTGPLIVHGIRLDTATLSVGIERAELRWQPGGIFAGVLVVDRLQAEGVAITVLQAPEEEPRPEDKPFELPARVSTPVSLTLRELVVNDLKYRSSPTSEPLVIDRISAALGARDTHFNLERLAVAAPLFDIHVQAHVTARGEYPLDAGLDITLRPNGFAPLRSTTTVGGSLQSLRVHEAIAEPYNFEARARISDPFEELEIDVSAGFSEVNTMAIKPDLPDATLSAQANAGGTLSKLELQAKLGAIHQGQRLNAELTTALEDDELQIDSLSLTLPEHQARVDANGRVRLTGNFPLDASLTWQNLKWPLRADPHYSSAGGRATVAGSVDDYRLSTNAELTLPGDVPVAVRVTGKGSREHLDAGMRVHVLEGQIDGTTAVSWQPSFQASIDLAGNDVDPAAFSPDWPGLLDFTLRAQAAAGPKQAARARLETLVVNGELRGEPLSVESEGAYQAGELILDRLRAELGATRVTAHGRYSDTADLEWQIESDDLGRLLPQAAGKITSQGTLSGSPPQLVIDATLNASGLAYQDNRIGSLALAADVDLTDRQPSKVDLRIEGIDSPALTGNAVDLAVEGRLSDHRASLTADTNRGSTDLQVEGRLRDPWSANPAWLYKLTQATVAYPELRPWELDSAAEGTLAGTALTVRRHCWKSGAARLCLAGQRTREQTGAEFTVDELGFDYFAGFLPAALELDGELSGRGEVKQPAGGTLQADVALQTGGGRVALQREPAGGFGATTPAQTLLDLEPSRLSLTLDENTANASASLNFGQGRIDFQADLSPPTVAPVRRALDGQLQVDVPDIAFIAPFVPDIEDLQGNLKGELEFAGTQARPRLSGRIALADAALTLPAAGVRLEDLAAVLEGRDDGRIGLDASVRSGGGSLELTGDLGLGEPSSSASIEISGEDFQVVGNEDARVFVTPDLNVDAGAEEVRITGVVRIPRAEITPADLPESAVTASKDVIVMPPGTDDDPTVEDRTVDDPAGRPVHAKVQIVPGDDVRFEGFGLKARVEGDTTVFQEPGQPVSATGEITIAEGEYRAYGQGLVIESGKILFAGGPVTEPALDIRAVRRPKEGILVGSHVRGRLEEPEFSLFSEPPMTQQEQLSWLVLGRSLEEAPEGESSALAQASLALGMKGGSFLAENIGSNLGVDEFTIKSGSGEAGAESDPGDAAFVIGKYLSPKLYLSYGIGLFNPVSVLTMQYEINRRLQLMTESSSESTGADLVYTFERGE